MKRWKPGVWQRHKEMAEEVGFEPTRAAKTLAIFKTAPFIHSGTPPHSAGSHSSGSS